MPATRRTRLLILATTAVALLALSALPLTRALLWRWESNPVLRGRLLAAELGCEACHRPHAGVEIPNPGSRWGTVPRFGAGNGFMYDATDRAQVEEYIRFGAPRGWLDDPDVAARLAGQRLRMPAYGDRLGDGEIADLVAWVAAVEGLAPEPYGPGTGAEPDPEVGEGRKVARTHGCLSCHGVEGAGGLANPGSLGGFIPGFKGRNFAHMVEDEAEFREWVRTGTSERLAANPLLRPFWLRQELVMPAYGDDLSDQDLARLWAWVEALRVE